MATVISIALQKGGSAKTTTSLNLASELGVRKKRVLLIDLDAQANSTYASGYTSDDFDYSLYNILTADSESQRNVKEVILNCKYYDLIPSERAAHNLLFEIQDLEVLKKALEPIQNDYDFIILDCPPAISTITINAFIASQKIIIPCECKTYSFLGITELKETIDEIKKDFNPDLEVLGVLLVKFDKRTVLTQQIEDLIKQFSEQLNTTIYNATIRNGIIIEEATLSQTPLCDYAKRYKGNKNPYIDYRGFATETLKRLECTNNESK